MGFHRISIICLLLALTGWSAEQCKFAARAKAAIQGKNSLVEKLVAIRSHVQKTVSETDAHYG